MALFDQLSEKIARQASSVGSRRSFIKKLGAAIVGATIPVLPIARGDALKGSESAASGLKEEGDPLSCEYWRYCGVDGFLCSCCGGNVTTCPPGTEMSPLTWVGSCLNPTDGKKYLISYNDCCGATSCGVCLCGRNDDDLPMYRADKNNDINWCLGTGSIVYNCTTALVIGISLDESK
ncbi:hypothetical protein AwWohl_14010 [Gammaproteobacteria bacterium]|nr:hypothetical protein AwWohl_14010 [Gammaproteobacteria bacterium]